MKTFQLDKNGPVITWQDSDYNVVGSEKKGMWGDTHWVVKYTKGNSSSTSNTRIPKNSSGGSALGGWKIYK